MAEANIKTVAIVGDNHVSESIVHALGEYKIYLLVPQIGRRQTNGSSSNDTHDHTNGSSFLEQENGNSSHDSHGHEHRHETKVEVDLSSSSLLSANLKALVPRPDVLISTHHGGSVSLQRLIISAANEAGIPRFMAAEFGHDSTSAVVQARLPPHAARAEILEDLESQSSLQWIGLATGYPLDRRLADGGMGLDLTWQSGTVYGDGIEVFAASSNDFIGRAAASALKNWEQLSGRYVRVSEFMTSIKQVVTKLETISAKEWSLVHVEKEKCIEEAEKRMVGGWPDAGMFLAERSLLGDEESSRGFEQDSSMRKQLNLPVADVDSVLQKALAETSLGKGGCDCA